MFVGCVVLLIILGKVAFECVFLLAYAILRCDFIDFFGFFRFQTYISLDFCAYVLVIARGLQEKVWFLIFLRVLLNFVTDTNVIFASRNKW